MAQIHKNFSDGQVKALFEKYERGEIERRYIQEILFSEIWSALRLLC